ncbi:photosystem II assembly protein Psb34 [cf. Phormidesmis sp. LEGE 11477]|uniref:photosystem II assembly protein Psb34 n=1 Tax=cf. Phormidesmis sp. LEGE 11477 TaxID=1828680 RepID=UPI0018803DA8|nr:ssl1498 family light-harvesting-like protein [cf. Phormidesmis sp. LEGE 11477]MBE9062941.1 ssl1498 family light-harvesting-like protein [cf. Phormidesmis sp. LEGE 11477]
MRYTEDEGGLLNNFAVEPKMYQAEPPTGTEKRNYIILGSLAASLVVGLFVVAASVS